MIHVNSSHCNAIESNQIGLCAKVTSSTLMILIETVLYFGVKMRLLVDVCSVPFELRRVDVRSVSQTFGR